MTRYLKIQKAKELVENASFSIPFLAWDSTLHKHLIMEISSEDLLVDVTVTYGFKGWSCDAVSQSRKDWGCVFNPGKVCSHIIAAQLYLRKQRIKREWMQGVDWFYYLSPLYSEFDHDKKKEA